MSLSAPTRSTARAPRPSRAPAPRRPLRVVTGTPPRSEAWFVALCVGLVLAGFAIVLLANTAMAQGTYQLDGLRQRSADLAARADTLSTALDQAESPGVIARRAASLGLVQAPSPAFLRLSDGRILGVARPAPAVVRPTVASRPSTPTVKKPAPTTPAKTTTKKH